MTVSVRPTPVAEGQHIALDDVSWDFYERLLEEIGDRPIRVTFDEGSIEIMSPPPKHETVKKAIASLLELLTIELNIQMTRFGSTTFRREDKQKGLEPDECYYLRNTDRVRGMQEYDPDHHPPPDLAIEVDITSRSIARQPIYAALGVPELWRYNSGKLEILVLHAGTYSQVERSPSFPFLPTSDFNRFVERMIAEDQTTVLREFRDWAKTLVP